MMGIAVGLHEAGRKMGLEGASLFIPLRLNPEAALCNMLDFHIGQSSPEDKKK